MACVYVLHSKLLNKYYVGSCLDLNKRVEQHNAKEFKQAFTTRVNNWEIYFVIQDLDYKQARSIEKHIKRMKSKKYVENLKLFPLLVQKLKELYK